MTNCVFEPDDRTDYVPRQASAYNPKRYAAAMKKIHEQRMGSGSSALAYRLRGQEH